MTMSYNKRPYREDDLAEEGNPKEKTMEENDRDYSIGIPGDISLNKLPIRTHSFYLM